MDYYAHTKSNIKYGYKTLTIRKSWTKGVKAEATRRTPPKILLMFSSKKLTLTRTTTV